MKKVFKFVKNNLFAFLLGGIVCSAIVVIADTEIASNVVSYDTSTSHSGYNTVQGAIDDLYRKVPSSAGLSLIANGVPGLSSTLVAGMYRYQGTTADNYICFGTTNQDTCKGDTDAYMYRIIGVNAAGQMKLIKKEALNTSLKWNSSSGVEWPNSDLYKGLNGIAASTANNYFIGTSYVPSGWEDRMASVDWHYWTGTNVNVDAATMATNELGASTVNAKVGLIYLHDYYYGLSGGNNCSLSGQYSTCKTSWIFLFQAQNDSSAPNTSNEWIISRYSTNRAWFVTSNGYMSYYSMTYAYSVRPVFYLTSSQEIKEGSGGLDDPYVLW